MKENPIDSLRDKVAVLRKERHKADVWFYNRRVARERKWKQGASLFYKTLIECYGKEKGMAEWAKAIRKKKQEVQNDRKAVLYIRNEYKKAVKALKLASHYQQS